MSIFLVSPLKAHLEREEKRRGEGGAGKRGGEGAGKKKEEGKKCEERNKWKEDEEKED